MDYNTALLLLLILSMVTSYFLTKWLIRILTVLQIVDKPDNIRRLHKYPTPRGAGMAILITLIIVISLQYFCSWSNESFISILPLLLLIATISLVDDIRAIPAVIRLFIHLFCAAISIFLFLYPLTLFHEYFPRIIDFIIAIICFAAFINIYNFLDGMDGLTLIESIHLSCTILILCYLSTDIIPHIEFIKIIAIVILGSSVGILAFNWPPAKIFLGDIGSISLGFLLGLCSLLIAAASQKLFIAIIIANLYYLADGGGTILIRLVNGEKIWQPHFKHFFQKALQKGMSNKKILRCIILCNLLLAILAINSLYYPVIAICLSISVVTTLLFYFVKI